MNKARILIVEDENVVAKDIQGRLNQLGYSVPFTVASGEEALRKAREIDPQLILMDIRLSKGFLNGVEAAEQINEKFDIPVVYLTAYADQATMERAKLTNPFGYILKPFQTKELHISIEMALFRHQREREARLRYEWLLAAVRCADQAILAIDTASTVRLMNAAAEMVTGWTEGEAIGRDLETVFRLSPESPVRKEGYFQFGSDIFFMIGRDGTRRQVEASAAPIEDKHKKVCGSVFVFRRTKALSARPA